MPGRDQNLEIAVLNQISHAMAREKNVPALLAEVLGTLYRQMDLQRGTVTLLEGDELVIHASHGLSDAERKRGRYHLGEGVTGQVGASGKSQIIPDISRNKNFLNRTGSRESLSHIAFICVPIIHRRRVIGTMSIDRDTSEKPELERDIHLLEIVAGLLAEAVSTLYRENEEREQLRRENDRLRRELENVARPQEIVGDSPAMQRVYAMIGQVADSDATVLIRGESGTGKELVARAIQRHGGRRNAPFVVVNCAALPEGLVESELFGHERGAFTGAAARRIGRVEAADTGTIFLDEIGDLAPSVQVKLLRFIQERTFQRIGSNAEQRSDVRILAATSRDLERLMAEGKFREDLYYRLNVFPIRIPSLAERKEDILSLAEYFLEKFSVRYRRAVRGISAAAARSMLAYAWPGNVRELENRMERAVLTAGGGWVELDDLPAAPELFVADTKEKQSEDPVQNMDLPEQVERLERRLILAALRRTEGNVAAAARVLNLSGRILRYKIKQLGIQAQETAVPGLSEG